MTIFIRTRADFEQFISFNDEDGYMVSFNDLFISSLFQPIFRADERLLGFEALVRVKTREGTSVAPDHIFRTLKMNHPDFINQINIDQLSRAVHLRNFSRFNQEHLIFINMLPSTAVFYFDTIANQKTMMGRLGELNVPPSQVVIEIVEHSHLDALSFCQSIKTLKENGFKIAVDDYGTQYSNETRVREIRPEILKIDRSLLLQYMNNEKAPLLEAIALGRDVFAKVLVEGIENNTEYDAMRALNVDYFQGYYLGKPEAFSTYVQNNQTKRA